MNPEHYDFCTVDGAYREITVDGIMSRHTVHAGVDFLRPIMQLINDEPGVSGWGKATTRMNCAVTVDEDAWLKQGRVVWIEPQ